MKARYSLYVVALFVLAACQPKSDNIAEKLKKQSEEIQRETDKQIEDAKRKIEEMKAILTAGGLPANVYLSKVLVKDSSSKDIKPVDQIKIQLSGGLGKDGKRADISKLKLVQLDDSQVPVSAEPKPEKTYINFDCSNLPASDIGDYKPVKAKLYKDTLFLNAARVFVCGTQVSKNKLTLITANEFILSNATVELKDNNIAMVIRAKTLILIGKNKFIHKGRKSANAMSESQGSISILAEEKLHLQDSSAELEIVSEGSSYEAADKPADKAETPADPKKDGKTVEAPKN